MKKRLAKPVDNGTSDTGDNDSAAQLCRIADSLESLVTAVEKIADEIQWHNQNSQSDRWTVRQPLRASAKLSCNSRGVASCLWFRSFHGVASHVRGDFET